MDTVGIRKFGKLSIKENLVMEGTFDVVIKSGALLFGLAYIYVHIILFANVKKTFEVLVRQ